MRYVIIGASAAGGKAAETLRRYAPNSLSLRGVHLITGGLGPEDTQDCDIVSDQDVRRGHYRRLIYRGGKLVGLTLVGAVEDAGIYFQLMAQQLPVAGPAQPGRMWG